MKTLMIIAAAVATTVAAPAFAQCTGNCGTSAPNGVVTAPPAYGPNYDWVSTNGGASGAGEISGVGGTNGSQFISQSFTGAVGDSLNFYLNYVTGDAGGFTDYGFAELLLGGKSVGYLFTARTNPNGNVSPGFGLPANISTLTPATTAIIDGNGDGSTLGPVWAPLGGSSGACYLGVGNGCGYTDWIASNYTLTEAGDYQIRFGVTNFGDTNVDSGLAYAGLTINNVPIGAVPEPTTWAMMIGGFGMIGGALRRRKTAVRAKVSFA